MIDEHTIPDLPTLKYFCPYSEQPMSIFSDFLPDFFADAPSKVSKAIHHVRTVCELTFSIIQMRYTRTPLFCLHLQNFFSKNNAPCVLHSLMPTRPFLNGCCLVGVCFLGFMHSSSSSSVSCSHLSMTSSNLPYGKTANFHKVLMQN